MRKETFLDLAPGYVGDILYEHLQHLQTDAVTSASRIESKTTHTKNPEGMDIGDCVSDKQMEGHPNILKLSPISSTNPMADESTENLTNGSGFHPLSPQHVPYPYPHPHHHHLQLSPPSREEGSTAAAMAAATQHHAIYGYGSNGVTSYSTPQGPACTTNGYDYHQFYAAAAQAMAATAMAAARSYGEGHGGAYGYPPVSPTNAGRDSMTQQYPPTLHHQHHPSMPYNPLNFSSSNIPQYDENGGGASTRSISSPPAPPHHSTFVVSLKLLF